MHVEHMKTSLHFMAGNNNFPHKVFCESRKHAANTFLSFSNWIEKSGGRNHALGILFSSTMPSIDHTHHNITMTMASTLYKMWLITLQSRYHYAHFIDKKIEAQQVQMCDSSIVDMFYKKIQHLYVMSGISKSSTLYKWGSKITQEGEVDEAKDVTKFAMN